jgi:hypothetical protein
VDLSAQLKNPDLAMPGNEFTQRHVDRVALGFRTEQALSLAQDTVVDVNIGSHTHQFTPPGVYASASCRPPAKPSILYKRGTFRR